MRWKHVLLYILFGVLSITSLHATTVVVTAGNGGNFFSPAYFTINPGDTVKWIWINGQHNSSSTYLPTGATTWYGNLMTTTDTVTYTPTVSGLYNYTCTHHSGMDGQFFVTGCSFPAKPVISGNSNACKGDTVLLSTNAQAGVSYTWLLGSTALPSAGNTCKTTTSGNYKVIVNRCGVDSISTVFDLYIDTVKPSFTYTNTGLSYSFLNTTAPVSSYSYQWIFSDGSPLQTTVNATHIFASPGVYTVSLIARSIAAACTDTTTDTLHVPLSIGSMPSTQNSVYPNPASDIVYLPSAASVVLTDMLGRRYTFPPKQFNNQHIIDVSDMPPGVYTIQVLSSIPFVANLRILH